jgi:hypothetical protein
MSRRSRGSKMNLRRSDAAPSWIEATALATRLDLGAVIWHVAGTAAGHAEARWPTRSGS